MPVNLPDGLPQFEPDCEYGNDADISGTADSPSGEPPVGPRASHVIELTTRCPDASTGQSGSMAPFLPRTGLSTAFALDRQAPVDALTGDGLYLFPEPAFWITSDACRCAFCPWTGYGALLAQVFTFLNSFLGWIHLHSGIRP
jgi:hypothetical protein